MSFKIFFLSIDLCNAISTGTGKEWFGGMAGNFADGFVEAFSVSPTHFLDAFFGVHTPESQRPVMTWLGVEDCQWRLAL